MPWSDKFCRINNYVSTDLTRDYKDAEISDGLSPSSFTSVTGNAKQNPHLLWDYWGESRCEDTLESSIHKVDGEEKSQKFRRPVTKLRSWRSIWFIEITQ